ncbi:MBG domain-containing protein [Algoriphagus sp. Y33]|uniref:MBG domain-containing protein n=1 Tax=Algoriphagus sp. Y33 TaxID=2772483 RepID=UPI00351C8355
MVLGQIQLNITPVNDAPTVANPIDNQNATQDEPFNFVVPTDTFEDVDVDDELSYSAQLSGGGSLPSWLEFDTETQTFSGTPLNANVGIVSIDVIADDGNGGTVTDTFDIIVANVNDAPTVANAIPNQNATENAAFNFQFAANTFNDVDVADILTYSAQLEGGAALPAWLSFDGATRTFSGTPGNSDSGNIDIEVIASDGNGGNVSDVFRISVTAVNDAPSISAPFTITLDEDLPGALTGISFSDSDAGTNLVTVTFNVGSGSLSAEPGSGVAVSGTSSSRIIEGNIDAINSFISNGELTFTTALNATSDVILSITINDNGNSGSGGSLTSSANVTLDVTAVNDAPVNSIPGPQQTDQNVTLEFSSGSGNQISVSDVDVGSEDVIVSLTASNGMITLSTTAGLVFTTGTGSNDAALSMEGSIADINAAFNGMTFTPTAGYSGLAGITITTNDQGFSGSGGAQEDEDVITIIVDSINPVVTSVTSSGENGIYKIGDELFIQVIFDQAVIVSGGAPTLSLETGVTDREVNYTSGSGTNTLNFSYTVQNGDQTSDLDYTSAGALSLNGSVIQNTSGDDAILTLPAVGSANSLAGQKNLVIDGVRPTSNIVVSEDELRIGETSLVTVTFSEAVFGFSNQDLSFSNGTLSPVSSADGDITWTATFTPTANVEEQTNVITLDNTGVENAGGNVGTGTTDSNNFGIDTRRPTAIIVVADTQLASGETSPVTIEFSEAVTGLTAADFAVPNGVLSDPESTDGITWSATFTPADGVEEATNVITLENTGYVDLRGNTGIGTTPSNNYLVDTSAPTVITQNITIQLNAAGEVSITPEQIDNSSTDGVGIGSLTLNVSDFDCTNEGENTVILTVTDVNGNSAIGTATVTVEDTIAPTVITQNIMVQLEPIGTITIAAEDVDNGSSDNCGLASLSLSQSVFGSSDIGENTVTLTVTDVNGNQSSATAIVEVVPLDVTGVTFENGSFIYDGTAKSLAIAGVLPAGTSVSYDNNTRTNVGTQEVIATITGPGFTTLVLTAQLTVTPATVTGITFEDGSFVYDGTEKLLAITGTLPSGTSVSYTGNGRTDVGTQEVTATITGSNYTDLVLTARLTVTPAEITGITFADTSFVYDGTEKSLAIVGTLPSGTSVAYTDNGRTEVGTQEVTATITGSNYTDLVLRADLTVTPATVTGITFEDGSFVYDGTEKLLAIVGTLPSGTSVAYTDNGRTEVGTQEVTATITGSNYTDLVLTAWLTVTPAEITGITFADTSFVYDGTEKSLAIVGTLPSGTSVSYTENGRTEVGTQEVTATITGSNYTDLVLTARLTITPAEITGITFADTSFVYDGTEKSLEITGTLPSGTSVSYTDNGRTDVGTQEVTAAITGSNFTTLVLTADLRVTPATVTGITFEDGSFVYDGTERSLAVVGTLPSGTSVSYTGNGRTEVGTQEVTATITGSNYTDLVLTADLRVTPATVTGITFEDGSFVYDGTEKSLAIVGTLPSGTSVAYTGNGRTDVGTQEVTATITGSNYTDLVLRADLTVTPATVTGITFEDGSFVYDGTEKLLAITGTLPSGTSVSYTDNGRTDVGTQEVTATITGSNYTDLVLTAWLTVTPAEITGITFADTSFVYDGTEKLHAITGNLPSGTSVSYTDNGRTDVGMQEVTATITGPNYTDLVLTARLTITPAEITGITFEDISFVYDGTEKSLEIMGTLPSGTSVAYTDNGRTDVGTQEVTATITGSNYTDLVLRADLTVTPATVTGITFEDGSFVYDGTEKLLAIVGTLPSGTSVAYTDNGRTEVGTQEVTATITGSNYTDLVLTAWLTVTPAEITGITFADTSFVYDGTEKSLAITGTLPSGTSVSYTGNGRTEVGTQEVTATITGSNYTDLVLRADLTVTPATVTGITFEDGSFVYDGTEKSLAIVGTLPSGTSVAYTGNGRTDVGTQEVTAAITGSNYTDLVLRADLTVTPATVTGITFEDGSFVYDGTEKLLAITGTLPSGTSVSYTDNGRTDVGTQEVTATITGSNYTDLVLTARLTITPAEITGITFEDISFVYDGTEKSLEIMGTLPSGTSVSYTDNGRTDVGTQEVTATITGSNYTDLVLTARLTITPAEITGITFKDGSFVYDGTEKSLAIVGTLPSGTSVSYTDNGRTDVGSQMVTATIMGSNLDELILTAELIIMPADLSVVADAGQSKVFGEEDPELTYTVTDFGVGDDEAVLEGSLEREPGEEVGTYSIVIGTLTAGSNYTVVFTGADFEILMGEAEEGDTIIGFAGQSLEVLWGTPAGGLGVPAEAVAITSKGAFVNLAVDWDLSGYDPMMVGTFISKGSVEESSGLSNPNGHQPILEITVLVKPTPQDVTLGSDSFVAVPDLFFQEIGTFTVVDPSDDQHTLILPEGVYDNDYFEVLDGVLFWSSAEQAEGRTEFTVSLRVTDRAGNVLDKDFNITRERTPLEQLEVPNTFTPDGDGINDTWGVPGLRYYSGVRISVFAVGGDRMFYTGDPDVRWDGSFNGKEMPVGAYLYVIEVGETGGVIRGMLNLINK